MGDEAHCTIVRLPGSILDGGSEDTASTGDHGALKAGLEGVNGLVRTILTVGRHFQIDRISSGVVEEGQRLVVNVAVVCFPAPGSLLAAGGGTAISN